MNSNNSVELVKQQKRKKYSSPLSIICQKEQRPQRPHCTEEGCSKILEASAYQNDSMLDDIDQEELQNLK